MYMMYTKVTINGVKFVEARLVKKLLKRLRGINLQAAVKGNEASARKLLKTIETVEIVLQD